MMSRLAVYIAGGLVLLIGVTALTLYTTEYVEQRLAMEASEVFNTWAFREVSYTIKGDQLTLSGQIKDQDLIDRAERAAVGIVGVGRVNNLLRVKPASDGLPDEVLLPDGTPIERMHFIAKKRLNRIYLAGVIQSEHERKFIQQALSGFVVLDHLDVKPLPKRWGKKLFHLIRIIKKFERVTLNIQGRTVHIHGTVKLGERIDLIPAYIARLFPNSAIQSDLVFESLAPNASDCQGKLDVLLNQHPTLFVENSDVLIQTNDELFNQLSNTMKHCPSEAFELVSSASHSQCRVKSKTG